MPFESKHQYFKRKIKISQHFKNFTFSLATIHKISHSIHMLNYNPDINIKILSKGTRHGFFV